MKKLTESNKLLLKAVCLEMGIKGEIDDYGNVFNVETKEEGPVRRSIFGIELSPGPNKVTKKNVPVMTLQEIMSKHLGLDYDPNDLVVNLTVGMLGDKNK